ncbi:hypothetical protein J0S39_22920, partial [Escherichia coli]|nr:hypothetical protein [Escherichia coli]
VLIEGGKQLLDTFINDGLWDEAFVEKCPQLLKGSVKAPDIHSPANCFIENHFGRMFLHYTNESNVK